MKKYVEYQESRYGTIEEIKRSTAENDWTKKSFNGGGVPVYSDLEHGKTYNAASDIHTATLGGTGSRKSNSVTMTTFVSLVENGESIIVTDPKCEIYRQMIGYLKQKKITVNLLDFRYPEREKNNCWNPLTVPYAYYTSGKKDKAIEMLKDVAKTIFGELSGNCTDLFWTNTAEEYFSGLALVLFKEASPEQVTLEEIANLEVFGNERMGIETYLKAYVRLHKDERLIVRALNGVIVAPNDTRGSIQSVFHQPLGNITCQENLNEMLSRTDFDVVQMGRKQTVTFLIMPDEKTTYNFLVTMFLKQCYELLIDCAETEYNGRLPVRVNWLLEETGNIPGLQDFENMMTASRSRNIRFFLVFQSLKQIERKYPGAGEIILGNCDCILFLNSKDTVLLEYISQLAGKYKSRYGHEERDLISVTELQHLSKEKGECIVFLERNYPFLTQLPIIYDYEAFIPMKKEVIKEKPRKVVERKSFDFQELVKQQLSRECEKRKKEADEEKRLREKDIELVIEKIDRKIAELEAEERKENND